MHPKLNFPDGLLHPRAHPSVRAIRTGYERPAGTAGTPAAPLRAGLVTTFYTYLEATPARAIRDHYPHRAGQTRRQQPEA